MAAAKAKNDRLKADFDSLNREMKRAINRTTEAQDRARVCEKDLALLADECKHEVNDINRELENHDVPHDQLESDLRAAFEDEVESELADKRVRYADQVDRGIVELKQNYLDKSHDNQKEIAHKKDENDHLDRKNNDKKRELDLVRQAADHAAAKVREAVANVKSKTREINRVSDEFAQVKTKAKATLQKLRVEKHQKDRAFDDLMDVRIALDMEIKRYTSLLDNEESRLNYVSPHKRGR